MTTRDEPAHLAGSIGARGARAVVARPSVPRQSLVGAQHAHSGRSKDKSRGWILFFIGLLVFGSGVLALRINVGGLLVHPQLLLVAPVFLWIVGGNKFARVKGVAPAIFVVVATFGLSHLLGGGPYGQFVKLVASLLTLFVAAALTRSSEDLRLGTLGLALGVGLLAARGVFGLGEAQLGIGLNPTEEVANKNYFSLLGLPALFAAGAWLLYGKARRIDFFILAPALALISLGIAGSANRSGWISLAAVPLLLAQGRRTARMLLGLAGLILVVAVGVERMGLMPVIEERVELTRSGYASDTLREDLYRSGVEVFANSPLVGCGLPRIDEELGRAMLLPSSEYVGPHSVVIYVIAGGGLLCAIPFGLLAWKVVHPLRRPRRRGAKRSGVFDHAVAWMIPRLGLLWLVRGLFTDEILYSPAFSMAFGLLYGCVVSTGERSTAGLGPPRVTSSPARFAGSRVGDSRRSWEMGPHPGVSEKRVNRESGA